jgi:hypothetical protein
MITNDFEFVRYRNAILLFFSTYRKESLSFHTALIVLLILYEGICHRNCWDRSVVIHPSLAQSDFVRLQSVELPLIPPLLRSASPLGTNYHRYWKLGGVYCVISPRSFAERERLFFLSHDVLLFLNRSQLAVVVVFSLLCVHFENSQKTTNIINDGLRWFCQVSTALCTLSPSNLIASFFPKGTYHYRVLFPLSAGFYSSTTETKIETFDRLYWNVSCQSKRLCEYFVTKSGKTKKGAFERWW